MTRVLIGVAAVVVIVATVVSLVALRDSLPFFGARATPVAARSSDAPPSPIPSPEASPTPFSIVTPSPLPPRSFTALSADLTKIAASAGARVSVTLIELGGSQPTTWSLRGDVKWIAASTYKLPLLMAEAQGIAAGRLKGSDKLCYKSSDWEIGYYSDYRPGMCFTRDTLAWRVGQKSDNTAAHILVRYLGGSTALNAFARSMGTTQSQFYLPNTTTSLDLARLWASEANGKAGGEAAQRWLYPLLTKTAFEAGIPAGTPKPPVVHKIGEIYNKLHDAALIVNGPRGAYILVICSEGLGTYPAGWQLPKSIAARVWKFEAARPAVT